MGGAIAQYIAINYPDRTLSLTLVMAPSGNPSLPPVAKPDILAKIPPLPAEKDIDGFIGQQIVTFQLIGSPGYPTDEKTIREQVVRSVERSYYPAGLARQQIVSLVGQVEGASRNANLVNIRIPTTILQGAEDPVVPVESAQNIASQIPNAELTIIPGLGHDLPLQLIPTIADAITKTANRAKNQK
jgi:pimeloyl-ACP methyl ester carboxylesterase